MVFLDVALVGIVVGWLLGGRLVNLADIPIAGKKLVFTAIGLQVAAFPSGVLPWHTPTGDGRVLWIASYALLIAALIRNRALPGVIGVAAGVACNLTAIIANNGLMPVRRSALQAAGISYHIHNNSIQLGHPNLAFLIDRWAFPRWVPLANVYSVGDVLIALGTVVAVAAAMRRTPDEARDDTDLGVEGGGLSLRLAAYSVR